MSAILVIEQDPAVGQLFVTALEGAGYTVYLAQTCAEAYELLSRVAVGVVITDLNLPRGAGVEIVATIRVHFPNTRIVGITDVASEYDPVEAAPLLAQVELLPNPIDISRLLGTVQRVLASPARNA